MVAVAEMVDVHSTPAEVEAFGPGSLLWERFGDWRFLFVLPGAAIMQVMHPAVGSAVGEHSVVFDDPWGRAIRSMDSMMLWVYGGPSGVGEGKRLRALHKPIRGVDNHGQPYRANDPEPYAWVHGTAFERYVAMRRFFPEPLTEAEEDRLYSEILRLGAILRIPAGHLPPNRTEYWRYFHEMVANRLENHPTAQRVLAQMRSNPQPPPRVPAALAKLWAPLGIVSGNAGYWLTVGSFRPEIREMLQLRWTRADDAAYRALAAVVRTTFSRLPEQVRFHPYAYRARALARAEQRIASRASASLG